MNRVRKENRVFHIAKFLSKDGMPEWLSKPDSNALIGAGKAWDKRTFSLPSKAIL
jgi:hypothetical protein